MKLTKPRACILPLLLVIITSLLTLEVRNVEGGQVELPLLYLGWSIRSLKCDRNSPEVFYREVASPAILQLQQETKGYFGTLMDKIESSITASEKEAQKIPKNNKKPKPLDEQWEYLMETLTNSLDSAFFRIENSWGLFVSVQDTPPMPWEAVMKKHIADEFLRDVEYSYAMIEAIVRAGTKEIVGTLQQQLMGVVSALRQKMEKVSRDKDGDEEEDLLRLQIIAKRFKKEMRSVGGNGKLSFVNSLMIHLIEKSILQKTSQTHPSFHEPYQKQSKTFITDILETTAISLEAFRQKGQVVPDFWTEITQIMKELTETMANTHPFPNYLQQFQADEEVFIGTVSDILTTS